MVNQTDERVMQRRVKHAIGRPVTRVILDENDNIILNTGDIITNRAVEIAREAGMLEVLVDSVYDERPKFGNEELRAPRGGDASLDNLETGTGTRTTGRRSRSQPAESPVTETADTQPTV